MSFWESLSKKLGFTADESDERSEELDDNELADEEEYDEEDDYRYASRFSGGLFGKGKKRTASSREREEEEYDEDEYEEEEEPRRSSRRSNVIHDSRMSGRAQQEPEFSHRERIVTVRQIEECREIIQYLLHGESVMLNLENIDPKDCGRVVDLLSGAAFALQGSMLKVAHLSYLLAPENVEVIEEDLYAATRMHYR